MHNERHSVNKRGRIGRTKSPKRTIKIILIQNARFPIFSQIRASEMSAFSEFIAVFCIHMLMRRSTNALGTDLPPIEFMKAFADRHSLTHITYYVPSTALARKTTRMGDGEDVTAESDVVNNYFGAYRKYFK